MCCEKYTSTSRRDVVCANCDYVACIACNRTYLEGLDEDPKCMQCNHPWDLEFLSSVFPKAWIKGAYAKHREKVLVDRELAMLPASQHLVQNYKTAEALSETIEARKRERIEIVRRMAAIDASNWNDIARFQRIRQSNFQSDGVGNEGDGVYSRRAFLCKCPDESCRGFLSTQYKCGVCSKFTCQECREIVGMEQNAPHTCDPGTVETVRLIRKESKPCPCCGTAIFKIDGCGELTCCSVLFGPFLTF